MNDNKQLIALMETTPETLANAQYNELKAHAINRLYTAINCLETDNFIELYKMLGYSPAGDGYGCDDYYIYMGLYDKPNNRHAYRNILEVIHKLISLKYISNNNNNNCEPEVGMILYDFYDNQFLKVYNISNGIMHMIDVREDESELTGTSGCTISDSVKALNSRYIVLEGGNNA
jgi:hypothetical protein